jgi:hypothetical protein
MATTALLGFAPVKGVGIAKVAGWMAAVYLWSLTRRVQWRAFNKINPAPAGGAGCQHRQVAIPGGA